MMEVRARAVVVLDVKGAKNTQALIVIEQVGAGRGMFSMVVKVRDLWEYSLAVPAEERVQIRESVAKEPVFRALECKGTNAVTFNTAALFEVEKEAREACADQWTKPAFVGCQTERVIGLVLRCSLGHTGLEV